jgi:hypothetical protein
VVTRHRRPAGADRPRRPGRRRHDLGGHLDRQRQRRPGADPDKLVAIDDRVSANTAPSWERFWTVRTAKPGQVLRGVSFTPGTDTEGDH